MIVDSIDIERVQDWIVHNPGHGSYYIAQRLSLSYTVVKSIIATLTYRNKYLYEGDKGELYIRSAGDNR